MTPEKTAWLAGLLEGEGSFTVTGQRIPRVTMSSTDEDVIRRARDTADCGTVNGPYTAKRSTKPFWTWSIYARADVARIVSAVLPWLGQRRTTQAEALAAFMTNRSPHLKTRCKRGHSLADAIIRDGGRRRCRECTRVKAAAKYAVFKEAHVGPEPIRLAWARRYPIDMKE